MEQCKKIIQSNYSWLDGDDIYFVTEECFVLAKFNIETQMVSYLNKPSLKNRIEFITAFENKIYMVDMAGRWIAETDFDDGDIVYHQINCNTNSVGNYVFIGVYDNKIIIFRKKEPSFCVFNMLTKEVEVNSLDVRDTDMVFDTGCIYDHNVYLFSGNKKKYIVFSLSLGKILKQEKLPIKSLALYCVIENRKIFLLSENTIYDVLNNFEIVATIDENELATKICFSQNRIYFLPGIGEKIFVYSYENKDHFVLEDYPDDYEYHIKKNWGKFVGKIETDRYIYWNMRSNNYILRIDKFSDEIKWISPRIEDVDMFLKKSYFDKYSVINEQIYTLSDYINHITNGGN